MPNASDDQPRDGNGHYTRNPETAARDAQICRMRRDGMTLREIGAALDMHHKSVAEALQRALREIVAEPAEDVRRLELERLDGELERLNRLETAALAVLERQHVTVNNGHIIYLDDEPLLDDGPILQAIDRLVRIEDARRRNGESRRKLLGLDSATKVDLSGGVKYELVGVDPEQLT